MPGTLDQYAEVVPKEAIARLKKKAAPLAGRRLVQVNSAANGGGVAKLLVSMTPLLQELGIKAERHIIEGDDKFFGVTKKIHNALQSGEETLSLQEKKLYEDTVAANAKRFVTDHDLVVIHDPQPLPLIYQKKPNQPWVWRCHLDMSSPNERVWQYLKPYVERYDAAIFSLPEYRQKLSVPEHFFMPAIDPFLPKNLPLAESVQKRVLEKYHIPTDLPLVVQVSRFDRWKDPLGVIEAHRFASSQVPCRLVLLGNFVTDDPESKTIYEEIQHHRSDTVLIIPEGDNPELVNVLQQAASVVVQKSLREGFGLTVTEAMWKQRPVVGGDTVGIRAQITDGQDGYLVSSAEEAGERIAELLAQPKLAQTIGKRAHQTVKQKFLLPRLLEQELELYGRLL